MGRCNTVGKNPGRLHLHNKSTQIWHNDIIMLRQEIFDMSIKIFHGAKI